MKMLSSEVNDKNSVSKTKLRQHEVTMIGDSFLRGIRKNVELSLSNNFGTFSLVKPGCELKTLLVLANSAAGSLTQKDVIFICRGSNDVNLDKAEPTTDHIVEIIKTNNHTNILLTNVPLRYDLSYCSQINKVIRSYNKKSLISLDKYCREKDID
jgi:lysophospholipase L1-like esterase